MEYKVSVAIDKVNGMLTVPEVVWVDKDGDRIRHYPITQVKVYQELYSLNLGHKYKVPEYHNNNYIVSYKDGLYVHPISKQEADIILEAQRKWREVSF